MLYIYIYIYIYTLKYGWSASNQKVILSEMYHQTYNGYTVLFILYVIWFPTDFSTNHLIFYAQYQVLWNIHIVNI